MSGNFSTPETCGTSSHCRSSSSPSLRSASASKDRTAHVAAYINRIEIEKVLE